jgi:hypothetical protein
MAEARARWQFDGDTSAVNAKLEETRRKAGGVGEEFIKGVGGVNKMAGAIGGMASISAALLATWQNIVQTQEAAGNKLQSGAQARARVLARADSPEERQRLGQAIDLTRSQTGIDETAAANFQGQLEKGGLSEFREQFAQFYKIGEDGAKVADAIGNIRDVFGDAAGSVPDLIDKTFTAAKSSEGDATGFANTIARVGTIVKGTGTGFDDLAAILSQIGGKDIEQFSKGLRSLSAAAIKSGEKGGLLNYVDQTQSQGLSNRQLLAKLGNEGFDAYQQIARNRTGITSARAGLAGSQGNLGFAVSTLKDDLGVSSSQDLAQAEQNRDLAQRASGAKDLLRRRRDALLEEGIARDGIDITSLPSYVTWQAGLRRGVESLAYNATDYQDEISQISGEVTPLRKLVKNTNPTPPVFIGETVAHPELRPR